MRKKGKEQYPSIDIIKMIYDLDILILLGSDAHKPEEVGYEFKSITKMLKDIGFTHFAHYKKRNRTFIEI